MTPINYKRLSRPEKWLIIGIPALFAIGAAMHFLYDFTGKMTLIGIFSPVNESVWEHLKMLLLPMIGWWSIYYAIYNKKYKINKEKWFFASLISLTFSMTTLLAFYYTYTGAFGIESLVLDTFDLFLSVAIGQILGLHTYKYGKKVNVYISFSALILIVVIFVIFTFIPPHIPLFRDSASGQYGI